MTEKPQKLYALLAEFSDSDALLAATNRAYSAGYRRIDAYSPYPVDGLSEALGMHHTWLSVVVLGGGVLGALTGYGMQYYAMVIDYPLNVGGKPLHSWPAFIPVTFELTILFAGLAALLGMLALNGLPMPYHPVFNVERFSHASRDAFFLGIDARDPQFDLNSTRSFLESLGPVEVSEVYQ